MLRLLRRFPWELLAWLLALSACGANPAAPPAPLAEIPATMAVPQDLSIEVSELEGGGAAAGASLGLKMQAISSRNIRDAIQVAGASVEQNNGFLNGALFLVSQREIPVDASLFTFGYDFELEGDAFQVQFDFRPFDLDGDGSDESCSGCTCPTGCAPDIAACPSKAPDADLRPICFRIWLNGQRFMAGIFDRVPTVENPQSGTFRFQLLPNFDLDGSLMAIDYDHSEPVDLRTDLLAFLKDSDVGEEFFSRDHILTLQEGPAAESKKTARLNRQLLQNPDSIFRFQGQYFTHLDFIMLESIPEGSFREVLGLVPITPPLCAQISSADPVAQELCDDLGLALTAGDFPALPELPQVELPSISEFPESPPSP